ncbi:MAG: TIGR03936 family radical SAM-associated protein [Candidatus Margulisiibacteriota bacterium]
MQRIRIKYKKGGGLVFIGHLDMIRLWERAVRRGELPVAYSQGYNPRQKLAFGPPLPLGMASDCEYLDIFLEKWASAEKVKADLELTLMPGIEILGVTSVFSGMPSISSSIKTAVYEIKTVKDPSKKAQEILSTNSIIVVRKENQMDIRPMIKKIGFSGNTVNIEVRCDNSGSIKGSELKGLFKETGIASIKRTNLF